MLFLLLLLFRFVANYFVDIQNAQRKSELHPDFRVNPDYMSHQKELNPRYREVLIDWISSVRMRYELKSDTFALTVCILDRFLQRWQVDKHRFQLIGCTALFIASKYEEIYAPELNDMIVISDRNFPREQFLSMEKIILQALKFRLTVPYAHHFADRYILCLPANKYNNAILSHMTLFLIESSYQHYDLVGVLPSLIAAAATSLAILCNSSQPNDPYPIELAQICQYSWRDIAPIVEKLWKNVDGVARKHQLKQEQQREPNPPERPIKAFDSVYRLFSQAAVGAVATLVYPFDENVWKQAQSLIVPRGM